MSKAHSIESLTARFGRLSLDDPNPGPHVRGTGWRDLYDRTFEVMGQWARAYPEEFHRPPPVSTSGASIMLFPGRDRPSANLAHDIRTGELLATNFAYEASQGSIPMASLPDDPSDNPRPAPHPWLATRQDARRLLLQRRMLYREPGLINLIDNWF